MSNLSNIGKKGSVNYSEGKIYILRLKKKKFMLVQPVGKFLNDSMNIENV